MELTEPLIQRITPDGPDILMQEEEWMRTTKINLIRRTSQIPDDSDHIS